MNRETKSLESELLNSKIPLKLAFNDRHNNPNIVSLWFNYSNDKLQCVTHRSAWVLKCLHYNNKVGFELSTNSAPYRGIRGRGKTSVAPLGESGLLRQLIVKYLDTENCDLARWLLNRSKDERIISIDIDHLSSWDYSERMSDIS